MAKIQFDGMDKYIKQLKTLESKSEEISGKAIYEGSKIVADEIRKNIEKLPSKTGVTKKGLLEGLGIAPLQDDSGFLNVKIGFDGYNEKGTPNALMARVFESGSSGSRKHPFVRPAINATKKKAEAKMAEIFDEEIGKLMK